MDEKAVSLCHKTAKLTVVKLASHVTASALYVDVFPSHFCNIALYGCVKKHIMTRGGDGKTAS